MNDITSLTIGIVLLFAIFVYPLIKSIQELLQELKMQSVKQSEILDSILSNLHKK